MKYCIRFNSIVLIVSMMLLGACKERMMNTSRGPIVLGDSSTIVTETNPEYLTNVVTDIEPKKSLIELDSVQKDTLTPIDTATEIISKPVQPLNPGEVARPDIPAGGDGLVIEFKEVTVEIPNINYRSFSNQDVKKLNGVSYQLTSGRLAGNQLIFKGATITKVTQRYITTIVAEKDGKLMELERMDYTGEWRKLSGRNNQYPMKGLRADELKYKKPNGGQIRTAVSRTARANRYSKAEIIEWEKAVKNVRSVTDAPVKPMLQSVMWRIQGKDRRGKFFSKEIRLDLPI